MVQALEEQRHCFEVIISYCCGTNTGSMMSELIRRVFDDPLYLRFKYRPNCHLHRNVEPRRRGRGQGGGRAKFKHVFAVGGDSQHVNIDAVNQVGDVNNEHVVGGGATSRAGVLRVHLQCTFGYLYLLYSFVWLLYRK